mgnify:FL=1
MSYIALYRKYRPLVFGDIVGQENVTEILKKQIKSGRILHAYIFSGCRGTGKTSAAKIFARAVNCLNPKDGEPCNECEMCRKILEGTSTDIVEMDAASNNSVDNIRQIRQEVVYSTVDAKYRVYIIDEAHMLTTSAFNALLKTLEEPPENVIFILATTEQHKIPITILSRCLKFEFRRLSRENIAKRLEFVLKSENMKYDKEAVEYISKLADGALRDALSILDRCQSELGGELTYDQVLKIVGGISTDVISDIVSNILDFNSVGAITSLEKLINAGGDMRQLNSQLLGEFLNVLVNQNGERNNYKNVEEGRLIAIIDRLSKLDNDLRYAMSQQVLMKSCIVEICMPSFGSTSGSNSNYDENVIKVLEDKILKLEEKINKISSGNFVAKPNVNIGVKNNINSNLSADVKIDTSNLCDKFERLDELKKELAKSGKLKVFSALTSVSAYEKENVLVFISNNKFAYEVLRKDESISDIMNVLSNITDKQYILKVEFKEQYDSEETILEKVLKESGVSYTNMD